METRIKEVMDLGANNKLEELMERTKDIDDLSMYLTPYGENILHLGGRNNNVKMLEYGIAKKCYVNMCDYYGASPLYHASSRSSFDAVKYLVSLDADPRLISSFSGKNPRDTAKDETIRNFLTEYTKRFEKILENPYSNFAYRVTYEIRYSFFSLIHPNKEFYYGQIVDPKVKQLYDEEKINEIIDFCKECDKKYEIYLQDETKHPNMQGKCLLCEEKCDKMCQICGKAYICEKCLSSDKEIDKYKLIIHTNNCKRGIFK